MIPLHLVLTHSFSVVERNGFRHQCPAPRLWFVDERCVGDYCILVDLPFALFLLCESMNRFSSQILFALFAAFGAATNVEADERLYQATPLTKPGEFTPEIEGPCCDRNGNIYAVSWGTKPVSRPL